MRKTQDIMKFYLGAIPPFKPLILKATFYQMLEVVDLSWRLFVPNKIVPRYYGSLAQYFTGTETEIVNELSILDDKI